MSARDKTSLFKAAPAPVRNAKADQITETVRLITAAEVKARNTKTARLKELRLAKEAADAAEKAATPAPRRKAAAKTPA